MKVRSYPHPDELQNKASGIAQVVINYARYLPDYGIELVPPDATSYDIEVGHAAARPGAAVQHSHGILWTSEFDLGESSWQVNADLVKAAMLAKEITVPSEWVARPFRRDMRVDPHVIWHGVNWDEWQHDKDNLGYVLWAKNRTSDGLDPSALNDMAEAFPDTEFVTTFSRGRVPNNVKVLEAALPHEQMQMIIQSAAVVLSTDRETWGILPAEAMAAGVPVLSVDLGAVPDFMMHGESGYCYQAGNLQDALDGLAFCLKNRDALGANGREVARGLTWQKAAEKVAGVYRLAAEPEEPTVAIVIPCYNYGKELGGAIESAVNQDYSGITDIIVVDDGSTDDSVRTVSEDWVHRDRRVHYKRIENGGVAAARNAGEASSGSKYASFLDADDRIDPGFIGRLISVLEDDRSLGIAYTGVRVLSSDGTEFLPWDLPIDRLEDGQMRSKREWPVPYDYELQMSRSNQVPSCCLVRRKAFDRVGGYRARYCPRGAGSEDAELFLRLGAYGWGAKYVPSRAGALWVHAHGDGYVSAAKEYEEPDWTAWHPWARDGRHPFASIAKPDKLSHPVRSYENPLISVVIPVGPGHEESVIDALDSLEAQTLRSWEAIVFWDSDDLDKLGEIKKAYPHVAFSTWGGGNRESFGAGAARNAAVSYARAPLIAFLDADDYYHPDFLMSALSAFTSSGNIIYTDFVSVIAKKDYPLYGGTIIKERPWSDEVVVTDTFEDYNCTLALQKPKGTLPYTWSGVTILVPKIWHEQIGGFDERMPTWEDNDYLLRLAWAGHCFTRVPKHLWIYNFSSGTRRGESAGQESELMAYICDKYDTLFGLDGANTVCGCSQPNYMPKENMMDSGGDILIRYMHPNVGKRVIKGQATFRKYGYHGGGGNETFMVDPEDIRARPDLYQCGECGKPFMINGPIIDCPYDHVRSGTSTMQAPDPAEVEAAVAAVTPGPEPVEEVVTKFDLDQGSLSVDEIVSTLDEIETEIEAGGLYPEEFVVVGVVREDVPASEKISDRDWGRTVNKGHIKKLSAAGVVTLDDARERGYDGLVLIPGIGPKVAKALLDE